MQKMGSSLTSRPYYFLKTLNYLIKPRHILTTKKVLSAERKQPNVNFSQHKVDIARRGTLLVQHALEERK